MPAAVAVETLKIYDEMDIGTQVRHVGAVMQKALRDRFEGHPLVGEVRGEGLVAAVELVADKAARKNFDPALKIGARAAKLCEANGVSRQGHQVVSGIGIKKNDVQHELMNSSVQGPVFRVKIL